VYPSRTIYQHRDAYEKSNTEWDNKSHHTDETEVMFTNTS